MNANIIEEMEELVAHVWTTDSQIEIIDEMNQMIAFADGIK